jgi:hypothetical protein
MVPEEWPSRTIRKNGALQNPAYRLADILDHEGFGANTPDPSPFQAAIFCRSAISASGAVTFGEWLASIS